VLTAMDVCEDKQYYGDLKAGPYTFTPKDFNDRFLIIYRNKVTLATADFKLRKQL
jgi:hypothetical protein